MENIIEVNSSVELNNAAFSHPETAEHLKAIRNLQAEIRDLLSGINVSDELNTFLSAKSELTVTDAEVSVSFEAYPEQELKALKEEVLLFTLFKKATKKLEELQREAEFELQSAKKRRKEKLGKFEDTLSHAFSCIEADQIKTLIGILEDSFQTKVSDLEAELQKVLSEDNQSVFDAEWTALKRDQKFLKKLDALNSSEVQEKEEEKKNIEGDLHLLHEKSEKETLTIQELQSVCSKYNVPVEVDSRDFDELVQLMNIQKVLAYQIVEATDQVDDFSSSKDRQKKIKKIAVLLIALSSIVGFSFLVKNTLQILNNNADLQKTRRRSPKEESNKNSAEKMPPTQLTYQEYFDAVEKARTEGRLNEAEVYKTTQGNLQFVYYEGPDDEFRETIENDPSLTTFKKLKVHSFTTEEGIFYDVLVENGIRHVFFTKMAQNQRGELVCIVNEYSHFSGMTELRPLPQFSAALTGENQITLELLYSPHSGEIGRTRTIIVPGMPVEAHNLSSTVVQQLLSEKPY